MPTELTDLPLPSEQLPQCWMNDVRMTALFAPFRLRSVNPLDYDMKMKFWIDIITKWSLNKGSYTYDDVRTAFQRKGKYPACIDIVMENMIKEGKLCSKQRIQTSPQSWVSWGVNKMMQSVGAVGSLVWGHFNKSDRYVHMEALKTQSLSFLSSIPVDSRIGNKEELWRACCKADSVLDDNLELMLAWLKTQGLATCTHDGKLYKLSPDGSTRVKPLTESEICLVRLEAIRTNVHNSIDKLNNKSQQLRLAAKQSLPQQRITALSNLRKKKMVDLQIEKANNNLDSITLIIETIKQTHSDSEIFDAFKTGLSALKITMKNKGLNEDSVMDTMDEIKNTLDMYSDIESAISQPIGMSFDSDELELELQELIASEQKGRGSGGTGGKKDQENILTELPSVPQTPIPTASVANELEDPHKSLEQRIKNLRLASYT